MQRRKGVQSSLLNLERVSVSLAPPSIGYVINLIYRDGTEVGKERKISKFYRALVTGILEHDEVLSFPYSRL